MSARRLIAMLLILCLAALAWTVLGATVLYRTDRLSERLSPELASLWGPKVMVQSAPQFESDEKSSPPDASRLTADIRHENRYKGLLWFSLFTVRFQGVYSLEPQAGSVQGEFVLRLPNGATAYDELAVTLDDQPIAVHPADLAKGAIRVPLSRDRRHVVGIGYTTTGQDIWAYAPSGGIASDDKRRGPTDEALPLPAGNQLVPLRDFSLTVTTDFENIDYPPGTRSPTQPARIEGGKAIATWQYKDALTNQAMGVAMPQRTNAGPIAGGFFAFHVLLAYLADLVSIHVAFWICAAVSTALVVSYMRLVAGVKFAVVYVGLAQLVYLVGFSYAFFWVGRTGLTVTIGAVATLALLMHATGRVDWNAVFARPQAFPPLPPPPVQAQPTTPRTL